MTDMRFERAVRAASAKKPPGMGDFTVREMVQAALDTIDGYTCPVCGSRDPSAYARCDHAGCPDGRDPR